MRPNVIAFAAVIPCVIALGVLRAHGQSTSATANTPLPLLDAGASTGVREISKSELIGLMTKTRSLTAYETTNLDRGCPGFACIYQGLGLTRWPESARGTRAYLKLEDALKRRCADRQENFVFLKQAWWEGDKPPLPNAVTGEVSLLSITRISIGRIHVGWYSFNYAVYFPSTNTYAWMNHREYGFLVNIFKPQMAYLSHSPPPLEQYRPAQIYCSTCRQPVAEASR